MSDPGGHTDGTMIGLPYFQTRVCTACAGAVPSSAWLPTVIE